MPCWYPASDISLAEDNYRVVANELGMCDAGHGARGVGGWVLDAAQAWRTTLSLLIVIVIPIVILIVMLIPLICLGPQSDGIILNTQLVSWPQRLHANALLMQLATCHSLLAQAPLVYLTWRQRADEPSAWWTVNLALVNDAWWEHAETRKPTDTTYIRNNRRSNG